MYSKVKRMFDVILAICLLIGAWPFMLIAAIAIKIDDPKGPILFRQERIGYHNQPFKVCKFRTMRVETHKGGIKLTDEERMLRIGKFLRKISLDELPQLLNIFKGEMSFIGPRPLPIRYLEAYNEEEIRRHDVRPGISGLAQINGRNTLNWEERFKLDVQYVDNLSLKQDCQIFVCTIKKVFLASDVVTRGQVNLLDFDEHRKKQINETSL